MPDSSLPVIGFIGLGNMGMPMTARLIKAGYPVRGFDLSDAARAAFAAQGGTPVASAPAAAAGAAVVILMLPDSNVVEAVATEAGFIAALTPGVTVVDMSSSEPGRTRELARLLGEHQVVLIDAPVSGGVKGAVAGTLAVMAGGGDEEVSAVEPVLSHLGKVYRAGPVGAGHAVKALNNLMSAAHLLASAEAVLIGERFGVDPQMMLAIVNDSTGRSWSTQTKLPNFVVPQVYNSGFGLRLMLKDCRIATGLAAQVGLPARLGDQVTGLWAEAAQALADGADHTEIGRWVRDREPSPPAG